MGKIVANPTDAGQAVILTTTEEGVTGGYFDRQGEWHEFGGGGLSLQPIVHITLINEGGENPLAIKLMQMTNVIANEHLYEYYPYSEEIPVNGVYSWDALCHIQVNPEDLTGTAEINQPVDIYETDYSNPSAVSTTFTVRTAENCAYNENIITVTDMTKDATLELVTQFTISGHN